MSLSSSSTDKSYVNRKPIWTHLCSLFFPPSKLLTGACASHRRQSSLPPFKSSSFIAGLIPSTPSSSHLYWCTLVIALLNVIPFLIDPLLSGLRNVLPKMRNSKTIHMAAGIITLLPLDQLIASMRITAPVVLGLRTDWHLELLCLRSYQVLAKNWSSSDWCATISIGVIPSLPVPSLYSMLAVLSYSTHAIEFTLLCQIADISAQIRMPTRY